MQDKLFIINIFISVMPVLSTWVVLSSSQEEGTPAPELLSTTRLAGWRIFLLYRPAERTMAAPTSTMMREARYVVINSNYYPIITFQTMLVSGGRTNSDQLSSTELLVETALAWVFTGELPSPSWGLRGANIDNKVFMAGKQ